jgi:hypothetical protein
LVDDIGNLQFSEELIVDDDAKSGVVFVVITSACGNGDAIAMVEPIVNPATVAAADPNHRPLLLTLLLLIAT